MNYFDLEGDYHDACSALLKLGGQLYHGGVKDGAITHILGNNCFTYWQPGSKRRGQVIEACRQYGYSAEGMTGGRLARKLLKDVIGLDYKNTQFSMNWREIAKKGDHWHYQKCIPGEHGYTFEIDIKSAYFAALLHYDSLMCDANGKDIDDNGALERLRILAPEMPKWLRLQLLGCLASHEKKFMVRSERGGIPIAVSRITQQISYGAAFNAAHRAIRRNWRFMKFLDSKLGDDCVRMHTDSFTVKADWSAETEAEIWKILARNGYDCAIKRFGRTYLFDLNRGVIGSKIIGTKEELVECIEQFGKLKKGEDLQEDCKQRWLRICSELQFELQNRESYAIPHKQLSLLAGQG